MDHKDREMYSPVIHVSSQVSQEIVRLEHHWFSVSVSGTHCFVQLELFIIQTWSLFSTLWAGENSGQFKVLEMYEVKG